MNVLAFAGLWLKWEIFPLWDYFFLVVLFLTDLALRTFLAKFAGGFLMPPDSICCIVLAERLVARPMLASVALRFLALLIAVLALGPVFLPATPFFGF